MAEMEEKQFSLRTREYPVYLENVLFRLFLEEPWDAERDKTVNFRTLHTHLNAGMFVCVKGQVVLRGEDDCVALRAGDVAVVPAGVRHVKEQADPDAGFALGFSCEKTRTRNCANLYKTLTQFTRGDHTLLWRDQPELTAAAERILREAGGAYPFLAPLHLIEMLLGMARLHEDAGADETYRNEQTSFFHDVQRMLKLEQLIALYYTKNVTIGEAAQTLNIGIRQLDRIVRKRYGRTFWQLIMEKRIDSARTLLCETRDPVNQIAERVGFNSVAGLYREFRRKYGCTPAEYRMRKSGEYPRSETAEDKK